jgi:potassium voltage-gated channel Eag-related subfamily H protein 8
LFVLSFLQDRHIHVHLSNAISTLYPQENGVPQGSVLSVTLFAVAINGMVNTFGPSVTASLYVDVVTREHQLHLAINHLLRWAL